MNKSIVPPALVEASSHQKRGSDATATTASSSGTNTMEDFWNVDLSDLMHLSGSKPNLPPFQRSASCGDDCPSPVRGIPAKRGVQRSKSSTEAPVHLRSALKGASTQRARAMGKRNEDAPIRLPARGRDRNLSSIRIPGLSRSKTRSNSRPRTPSDDDDCNTLKRTVSFDKVQIREFQQVLGDNPCDQGPSLALGWQYREKKGMDLEKYESKRNCNGSVLSLLVGSGSSKRRDSSLLSPRARAEKALEWGFTREEINENAFQSQLVQQQRKKSYKEARKMAEDGARFDPKAFMQAARAAHGYA
ncbi:expressed unknown protein [Seminavis robusta]|uniref:Uncharacterized protein n=1 Tax=Seminavis robusta TaxID=568900 RepID=A0A9N8DKS9_9STRA|nr:expressed unknown protein [Seminavis robusta]|eukprot:Sro196_g083690.1 n/a (303) ;mRNA; r:90169-91077